MEPLTKPVASHLFWPGQSAECAAGIVVFILASVAWLLLIAPLQYFLFLVCGTPSRIALRSRYRLRAVLDDETLHYRGYTEQDPPVPEPKFGWDASLRDKRVTLANAFGAAALFFVGYFF